MVHQVLMARLERQDQRELLVTKDHLDLLDCPDKEECLDRKAQKEAEEILVFLGQKDK